MALNLSYYNENRRICLLKAKIIIYGRAGNNNQFCEANSFIIFNACERMSRGESLPSLMLI